MPQDRFSGRDVGGPLAARAGEIVAEFVHGGENLERHRGGVQSVLNLSASQGAKCLKSSTARLPAWRGDNDDGSDRQTIIKRCAAGEPLHLVPEPHNAHSKHAVRVVRANGQQLGYLPDETAPTASRGT